MVDGYKVLAAGSIDSSIVRTAIGIGLVVLLGYWSLKVIGPFLTVALWSAILAVALYPLFGQPPAGRDTGHAAVPSNRYRPGDMDRARPDRRRRLCPQGIPIQCILNSFAR